jgi:competence protein ComFC
MGELPFGPRCSWYRLGSGKRCGISFFDSDIIVTRWRWVFSSRSDAEISSLSRLAVLSPFRALLNLLFPDECRLCGQPLKEVSRIPVCSACLRLPRPMEAEFFCASCRTPFLNSFPLDFEGRCALCRSGLRGFDAAYCFGAYEGALRQLIHLYKYSGIRTLARPLGGFLLAALPRDARFDAIAPVPLHWLRRRRRGFNQSELLARELARRTGLPVLRALRRARPTSAQAGLSNTARRRNVSGAFRCRRSARRSGSLKGKRVLLIDDVLTTGSTAAACAAVLRRAGASSVTVLTVARVDRRMGAGVPGSSAEVTK